MASGQHLAQRVFVLYFQRVIPQSNTAEVFAVESLTKYGAPRGTFEETFSLQVSAVYLKSLLSIGLHLMK